MTTGTIILYAALVLAGGLAGYAGALFYYRPKAKKLDLLNEIFFGKSFKRTMSLLEQHWITTIDDRLKGIITTTVHRRIQFALNFAITNDKQSADDAVQLIREIAIHGKSHNPLAATVLNAAAEFFENFKNSNRLADKVKAEYLMRPVGEKIIFISRFILDDNSPFLIERILGVAWFEQEILSLIEFHLGTDLKIENLNPAEQAAFKKITAFYAAHDSKNLETEHLTRSIANFSHTVEAVPQ